MTRLCESDLKGIIYQTKRESTSAINEKVKKSFKENLNLDLILWDGERKYERFIRLKYPAEKRNYNPFGIKRKRVFRKEATYISR